MVEHFEGMGDFGEEIAGAALVGPISPAFVKINRICFTLMMRSLSEEPDVLPVSTIYERMRASGRR